MRTNEKLLLIAITFFMSESLWGKSLPEKIDSTFRQMYPNELAVDWQHKEGYYVADLIKNGSEFAVWINDITAEWVMTEQNVYSLRQIPIAVIKAFHRYFIGGMKLKEITMITFPNHQPAYAFAIDLYNSDESYQLIYFSNGTLYKEFDTTQLGEEIYPELFE